MKTNRREARQLLGCGYEQPLVELRGRPAVPMPWSPADMPGEPPTICPGYTTRLPEVVEVSRARLWFDKGDLRTFTRGEMPTEQLANAIEVLEIAIHQHQDVIVNRKRGSP